MGIVYTILILSILVFVHEFGHFIAAKLSGIKVNEFALFMGPKIFSIKGKETVYSLRLIPIGGFCSMEGEDGENEDERAFNNKPWYIRMIVLVAGPAMNIILAYAVMAILFSGANLQTLDIASVVDNTVASENGISEGDRIVKIDGQGVSSTLELNMYKDYYGDVRYETDEKTNEEKKVVYHTYVIKKKNGEKVEITTDGQIGVYLKVYAKGEAGFGKIVGESVNMSNSLVKVTVKSLGWLFTGKVSASEVSGPIGVTEVVGDVVNSSQGANDLLYNLAMLLVLISINLGVFNLLPIPALDGGRLLFVLIEVIRGKKLDANKEAMVNAIGFGLMILLMIVVAANDIYKIVK